MTRAAIVRIAVLLLVLATDAAAADGKYWIVFADKGPSLPAAGPLVPGSEGARLAAATLSPRALARRAKASPGTPALDAADLPVAPSYLARLERVGVRPASVVRWMNAVSAVLDDARLAAVRALPFVSDVRPVRSLRVDPVTPSAAGAAAPVALKTSSLDYGTSLDQNAMIGTPILHDLGITGRGVLVGMLDTGARWRVHEALRTRDVVAEHDFINDDDVTANQPGDVSAQDTHGTLTFSVIGGYYPGKLVGAAYGASYLIAKTELFSAEVRAEEDHWAAGIEWMEGLGADIVSSSLGYDVFDDQTGYFWSSGDFDGRTSVVARAAVRAARLGVVVVTSMGNEGNGDGVTGTMLTPADADSIISVGAVSFSRYLSGISGTGPTSDGRTKPDLVAPGVGVRCAVPGTASYSTATGTSLAAPLTAGAAALLLSVRPELTPIGVRDALRAAADSVDAVNYPVRPNNFTGWGLVDARKAVLAAGPVFGNEPTVGMQGTRNVVRVSVASLSGFAPDSVVLRYAGPGEEFTAVAMTLDSVMLGETSGRYRALLPEMAIGTLVRFTVSAADSAGLSYASPAPSLGAVWQLRSGMGGLYHDDPLPVRAALLPNYPNPFNATTRITYRVGATLPVSVRIYDLLGRRVAELVDRTLPASTYVVDWNAQGLPSGVYFCRYQAGGETFTMKMLLVR